MTVPTTLEPAPRRPARRRVALTGGIATGKSYVRGRFEAHGIPTLDADRIAHEVVRVGTPALAAIAQRFGSDVLGPDGSLDRRALARRVFADEGSRRALEAIVHPEVRRTIEAWFDALPPAVSFAVADVPLLYEVGWEGAFDAVVVTACEPEVQLRRVMARDAVSLEDAKARVAAQLPMADKMARASYVIRTDGTHEDTDAQVDRVMRSLVADLGTRA